MRHNIFSRHAIAGLLVCIGAAPAAMAYTDCPMEPTSFLTGGEGANRYVEICEELSPGTQRCVKKTSSQLVEPNVYLDRMLMMAAAAQASSRDVHVRFSENGYDCSTNWVSRDDFIFLLIHK